MVAGVPRREVEMKVHHTQSHSNLPTHAGTDGQASLSRRPRGNTVRVKMYRNIFRNIARGDEPGYYLLPGLPVSAGQWRTRT